MNDPDRPECPTNGRPWPNTRVTFPNGLSGIVEYYEWWWNSNLFPVKLDYSPRSQMVTPLCVTWTSSVVPISAAATEHRPPTTHTDSPAQASDPQQGVA
jgi:hypothetical protein